MGSNVLPNLNGRVLQGAETAGEYKEAGLPNITGSIGYSRMGVYGTATCKGAFLSYINHLPDGSSYPFMWSQSPNNEAETGGAFDASKSNAIYGNSTTVQPPAYTVRYYICYG